MLSHTLSVTYDTRPLLGRVLSWLDEALIACLLITFAVMVGVVSSQVFLRYALNTSLDWADELGRLMFVWTIFLAIPLGVRQGGISESTSLSISFQRHCVRESSVVAR